MTDEAKAELAKIENKIGDYICKLCKEIYDETFGQVHFTFMHCAYTELNNIKVERLKMLSLPWFDSYAYLYWYFYSLLEI